MDLDAARRLRSQERHEEARDLLVAFAAAVPEDAVARFEAAWVHDFPSREAAAVPFCTAALSAVEALLRWLAQTSRDRGTAACRQAIGFHADDVSKSWPA